MKNNVLIENHTKLIKVIREGFGGMLSNGNLVDRREHPEAHPIAKNTFLGTPTPKEITKEDQQ